jgi:hypothetical protein
MWALGASNDVLDKTEVLLWLSFLLVPISIAGAYWLALFRLRSVKALRTWLETFGFSLFYWLVIPILLGVGTMLCKPCNFSIKARPLVQVHLAVHGILPCLPARHWG